MSYVEQSDLKGLIPEEYLTEGLDDDQSGVADTGVWPSVQQAVADDIDGRIGGRFATPLDPVPAIVKAAAKAIALMFVYRRRGVADDQNPWAKDGKAWQDKLDLIGEGKAPLVPSEEAADAGEVVNEAARSTESSGRMLV
jgi:phage gp36-like protein